MGLRPRDACMYLGHNYVLLGQEADYFLQKGLTLIKKHSPKDTRKIYMTLLDMASNFRNFADYKKAVEYAQNGFDFFKNNSDFPEPAFHIECAFFRAYLGFFYNELEDYRQAEKELREAKKMLPTDHHHAALANIHLGYTLLFTGRYKEAEAVLQDAYQNYQKFYEKDCVHIGWIQGLMGLNDGFLGNFKRAHYHLEEGHRIFKNHFGATHAETARHIQYKGIVAFLEGNFEEAAQLLTKSLEMLGNHPKAELSKKYLQRMMG